MEICIQQSNDPIKIKHLGCGDNYGNVQKLIWKLEGYLVDV